ncbi:MAG: glycerophosphodiester phosphodiesterase [Acidobacteriia bacterium]|nr:glycerophosphodiester phosphodiesterase [Terriglobia bacterium]
MLLLGHRGARRYAPENTFAAFELALAHGCDGFELDVRLTADRRCVICHGPRLAGRDIEESRYQQLAPGTPCLPEVLARFAPRAFLDIELKVTGLEADVATMLRECPPQRGYFVSSFLPQAIERLYATDQTLPLGLICDSHRQLAAWTLLPIHALFLERRLLTPGIVKTLRSAGKKVFVWTVNHEREMRRCAGLAADGIISDDTKLLAETLKETRV